MAKTLEMEHGAADEYRLGHVSTLEAAEQWALGAQRNGQPLLRDPNAASRLARARVHLEVSTLLCRRAIWSMVEKTGNRYWGPMAKMFATEIYHRDATDLMDLAAPESLFCGKSGLGRVELGYRQSIGTTIYGGTSEIQRSLVAEQALGMPKSRS
jgi:alkylation response protein AidB-like acyl-CoA dehydrogenase